MGEDDVCYIRKYVIILGGGYSHWRPLQPKYWWGCVPGIPGGVVASGQIKDRTLSIDANLCEEQFWQISFRSVL